MFRKILIQTEDETELVLTVKLDSRLDDQDNLTHITELAVNHCSDMGCNYVSWEWDNGDELWEKENV